MYFDANSLYSCAVLSSTEFNFKWVETSRKEFILKCFREKKYNFLVECYIEYLEELHDLRHDYPLAPEKLVIDDEFKDLPYCEKIRTKFLKIIKLS